MDSREKRIFADPAEYPDGRGIKYFLSENVNIAFEIIYRKLFTDYLDDVQHDVYQSVSCSISIFRLRRLRWRCSLQ